MSFFPNECFICKSRKDLRRCSRCQMIFYCGEKHQKCHYNDHKEICKIISNIEKRKKISHIFENLRGIDQKTWKEERENAVTEVTIKMSRPLLVCEWQMFAFPRVCFVCHDANQQNLSNCPNCSSVSFCPNHKDLRRHIADCFQFAICQKLELELKDKISEVARITFLIIERIFFSNSKSQNLPKSMKQLLTHFPKPPVELEENLKMYFSDFISFPLTLYNAFQKIKLTSSSQLVVLIGGIISQSLPFKLWEIILHLMPDLKFLKIVILDGSHSIEKDSKPCNNCILNNKKLLIETVPISFEEYLKGINIQLNLIVYFDVNPKEGIGQSHKEVSKSVLLNWGRVSCPVVLTTITDARLKSVAEIVKTIYPRLMIYYQGLNEFASMKPQREWEAEILYRQNQLMIIYKVLHNDNENVKTVEYEDKVEKKPFAVENKEKFIPNKNVQKEADADKEKDQEIIQKKSVSCEEKNQMSNSLVNKKDKPSNCVEESTKKVDSDKDKNFEQNNEKLYCNKEKMEKSTNSNEIEKSSNSVKDNNEISDSDKYNIDFLAISNGEKEPTSSESRDILFDKVKNEWNYFYINACQVCHKNYHTVFCNRCKMISYCQEEHRKEHWPEHKNLCKVILGLLSETGSTTLFNKSKTDNIHSWVKIKISLILKTQNRLGRKLKEYERQMFLFPRTCFVCHESDSSILKTCTCGISLCRQHKKNQKHISMCKDFQFGASTAAVMLLIRQQALPKYISDAITKLPIKTVPFQTKFKKLPNTIKAYIDSNVKLSKEHIGPIGKFRMQITSEFLSKPLTALYGIQKLELICADSLKIHVIGATPEEYKFLNYWEILFHWLPNLKYMDIKFIGLEFNKYFSTMIEVCKTCSSMGKSFGLSDNLISRYDKYFDSKEFIKPDIIIGFNLDLHESEYEISECTWKETISCLTKINAPFIMTSGTKERAKKDHKRLCTILGKTISHNVCEENPFATLVSERDFETEELKWGNKFILIYKELYKAPKESNKINTNSLDDIQNSKDEKRLEIKDEKTETNGIEMNPRTILEVQNKLTANQVKEKDPIGTERKLLTEKNVDLQKTSVDASKFTVTIENNVNICKVKSEIKETEKKPVENELVKKENNESKMNTEIIESKSKSENVNYTTKMTTFESTKLPNNHSWNENVLHKGHNTLLIENAQLKKENERLKEDNQKLRYENQRLLSENNLLKDLRTQVFESIRSAKHDMK